MNRQHEPAGLGGCHRCQSRNIIQPGCGVVCGQKLSVHNQSLEDGAGEIVGTHQPVLRQPLSGLCEAFDYRHGVVGWNMAAAALTFGAVSMYAQPTPKKTKSTTTVTKSTKTASRQGHQDRQKEHDSY